MLEASLSTGVTLRYAAQGDPAGVPVVLLHGLTDSHPSYAPMTAHLPDHIRAYALTTRGHGDSDKPEHGYRLERAGGRRRRVPGRRRPRRRRRRRPLDGQLHRPAVRDRPPGADRRARPDGRVPRHRRATPASTEFRAELDAIEDPVPRAARPRVPGEHDRPAARARQLEQAIAESCKVPAHVWRAALDGLLDAAAPTEAGPDHGAHPHPVGRPRPVLPARRAAAPGRRRSPAPS